MNPRVAALATVLTLAAGACRRADPIVGAWVRTVAPANMTIRPASYREQHEFRADHVWAQVVTMRAPAGAAAAREAGCLIEVRMSGVWRAEGGRLTRTPTSAAMSSSGCTDPASNRAVAPQQVPPRAIEAGFTVAGEQLVIEPPADDGTDHGAALGQGAVLTRAP